MISLIGSALFDVMEMNVGDMYWLDNYTIQEDIRYVGICPS